MIVAAGWTSRPLGELVDILDSRRIPVSSKERSTRSGSVPYYGAAGQVGWIDAPLFDEPLVLLGEDGVQFFDRDKRKAYAIHGPAWVNNHAHVLRAKPTEVVQDYLLHYLNWVDYSGFANGTTRLKLTQAAMRSIPVLLPSLDEQQRIVEILEGCLSRVDAAAGYLAAADARAKTCVDAWLGLALAGHKTAQLQSLLDAPLANGRSVPTAASGFGVLRLTALVDGRIDLGERKVGAWTADEARPFLVREGDYLVSRGNGSLQRVALGGIVPAVEEPVAFPDTMIRIRPRTDVVLPEYFGAVWNSRVVRRQIEALSPHDRRHLQGEPATARASEPAAAVAGRPAPDRRCTQGPQGRGREAATVDRSGQSSRASPSTCSAFRSLQRQAYCLDAARQDPGDGRCLMPAGWSTSSGRTATCSATTVCPPSSTPSS